MLHELSTEHQAAFNKGCTYKIVVVRKSKGGDNESWKAKLEVGVIYHIQVFADSRAILGSPLYMIFYFFSPCSVPGQPLLAGEDQNE